MFQFMVAGHSVVVLLEGDVEIYVDGSMDYANGISPAVRAVIARKLLREWQGMASQYTTYYGPVYAKAYNKDGMGTYREAIFRKVGFTPCGNGYWKYQ